MLDAGYDFRTVQDLLGHKDVRTTMIYTHILKQGGLVVRNPLNQVIEKRESGVLLPREQRRAPVRCAPSHTTCLALVILANLDSPRTFDGLAQLVRDYSRYRQYGAIPILKSYHGDVRSSEGVAGV